MGISTDSILDALKAGVPYSLSTLTENRFYKTKIPEKRKRFPSVELIEVNPEGNTSTQESTEYKRTFNVVIFMGLRGGTTTGQASDITNLENIEPEILDVLENTPILDHKVTINDRNWVRTYSNDAIRPYIMSTLTITARQITAPIGQNDGVLVFDVSKSITPDNPNGDYTYSDVFNTDIVSGYRDSDETTTTSPNPRRYAGGFEGSFITHVRVSDNDLGTTGDKLNQLNTLRSNGEKSIIGYIYTDKSDETPTTSDIQNTLLITVDNVRQIYRTGDNTIFRITGKLLEPNTVT